MTESPQTESTPTNKDLSPLHALMENTWDFALTLVAEDKDEIMTQFTAEDDAGGKFLFMTPWGSEAEKIAVLAMLRKAFAEHGIKRYVMLSEAWTIRREGDFDRDVAPSEAPDRVEVVQVLGVDPEAGEVMSFQADILHEDGVRRLGKREVLDYGTDVRGRMVELLGPVKRATVN